MVGLMPTDPYIKLVSRHILGIEGARGRMGRMLRATYDQIYDGVNTGRYRWDQLKKTEKTHFGSLVEINLQREFDFPDGKTLDFSLAGIEVDCKFSQEIYSWMIPVEAVGQVCLGLTASDTKSRWSAGVFRPQDSTLGAANRDRKRRLTAHGQRTVHWLWSDAELPPNVLLHLPIDRADAILRPKSGQKRVNELFRQVQCQVIPRGTVATVARQSDYMKRVRYNGGARSHLQDEGIVILGHYESHARLADTLDLPRPSMGEFVSVRLHPTDQGNGALIDDSWWRVATPDDPVVRAPVLPRP